MHISGKSVLRSIIHHFEAPWRNYPQALDIEILSQPPFPSFNV